MATAKCSSHRSLRPKMYSCSRTFFVLILVVNMLLSADDPTSLDGATQGCDGAQIIIVDTAINNAKSLATYSR